MTTDNKHSVLTDEEIDATWIATPADPNGNDFVGFARAIEHAVLSKLRGAGEPSDAAIEALALSHGFNKSDEHWGSRYYTELGQNLFSFARELLSRHAAPQASAETVPDGYALVPVKPSEEMMRAMESCSDDWPRTTWLKAWAAALSAAPAAEGVDQQSSNRPKTRANASGTGVDQDGAEGAGDDGLTPKQAWWSGYRAGKGLLPDTPRQDAVTATLRCSKCGEQANVSISSANLVTHWPDGTPRDERDIASDPEGKLIHDPSEPLVAYRQQHGADADERAAFEAAWRELNAPYPMNSRIHDDGRYATPDIEREWRLWQARAALDTKKPAENIREGYPYDDPAFEDLCREYGIWGTAESALCAVFWRAGSKADDDLTLRQQYEDACIAANANAKDAERWRKVKLHWVVLTGMQSVTGLMPPMPGNPAAYDRYVDALPDAAIAQQGKEGA